MLMIPTKTLLVVAAAFWLAAGLSVAGVGLLASDAAWTAPMVWAMLIVFVVFLVMFIRISTKHTKRILGYTDRLTSLFKFFDAGSYIIMAVMICLGVAVRISGLAPDFAIASFYTGLGSALLVAAIYYLVTYLTVCDALAVK